MCQISESLLLSAIIIGEEDDGPAASEAALASDLLPPCPAILIFAQDRKNVSTLKESKVSR